MGDLKVVERLIDEVPKIDIVLNMQQKKNLRMKRKPNSSTDGENQ